VTATKISRTVNSFCLHPSFSHAAGQISQGKHFNRQILPVEDVETALAGVSGTEEHPPIRQPNVLCVNSRKWRRVVAARQNKIL